MIALAVGAGCGLDPAPAAPDGDGPRVDLAPHWDALVAQSGGRAVARWTERGTPASVYGALSAPGERSAGAARDFVAAQRDLLQVVPDELDAAARVDSPLGSHFTFAQRYRGVPVFGAEVKVHLDRDGRVVALTSTAVPELAVDPTPAISADRALALALAATPRSPDDDAPQVELGVTGDTGAPALAYRVTVPTARATLQHLIDARTGAALAEPVDLNRYVDGSGQVFLDNAVVATRNNNLVDGRDAASAVPTTAYTTVTLRGLTGNNRLDGQFASGSASRRRATGSNNSFSFLRDTTAFSETMAYFHIDLAQRYIQSLGFTNINNRQQVFSIDRSTADNSSYSPSTKRITYGTGGVDDAEDGEVIIHEYGHSVQDNQVPGFGAREEGGAMGEGFGDYLAATVTASVVGDFQLTCIAEWDATSYASGVPHCLRRLDSTKHYPQDADGEVHDDGEMWSASLFQIRTALGAAKADRVILAAHFLLSTTANFKDGSNALVTAALNLGLTATEVNTIRTILANRGFGVTA